MVEKLPGNVEALQRLERRLEQEWWWLNGALQAVAQLQSDGPRSVKALREQAELVDRKRVALSVRLAELGRVGNLRPRSDSPANPGGA